MEQRVNEKTYYLKPWQSGFAFGDSKYSFLKSAWATGKTLALIVAGINESQKYSDNLGVIFRKEFTDLRDSTIKDFESYTGLTVNSSREVKIGSSLIMFRHLEEINNIQNMNLGWYGIEQGDELTTRNEFDMLTGRLRRTNSSRKGYVIANANGHNWIWRIKQDGLYADGKRLDAHYEAQTYDNRDILPADYISSLESIKKSNPEIYKRFVENSDDIGDESFVVIPQRYIELAINRELSPKPFFRKYVTVCDVAGESENADETAIYNFENWTVKSSEFYKHRSLMDTVGRIQAHALENSSNMIVIDKVGEGSGVYSRLCEIYAKQPFMTVYGFDSRLSAPMGIDAETYGSYKAYAWFKARNEIQDGLVTVPDDQLLKEELSSVHYKYVSGRIELESKKDICKRLGHSPNRADAFVMGLDGVRKAREVSGVDNTKQVIRGWCAPRYRQENLKRVVYV